MRVGWIGNGWGNLAAEHEGRHVARGLRLEFLGQVPVAIHREGQTRVAEPVADDERMDARPDEVSNVGVPKVMQANTRSSSWYAEPHARRSVLPLSVFPQVSNRCRVDVDTSDATLGLRLAEDGCVPDRNEGLPTVTAPTSRSISDQQGRVVLLA